MKKTILVVEDDRVSAQVLQDFLHAHGYDTKLASDGVAAVEQFQSEKPDLMLLDVMLPRKNGFEVCFDVKRTEQGKRTPVLLMSAVYRDREHALSYSRKDLKAQGYLLKPFDLETLLAHIQFYLGDV